MRSCFTFEKLPKATLGGGWWCPPRPGQSRHCACRARKTRPAETPQTADGRPERRRNLFPSASLPASRPARRLQFPESCIDASVGVIGCWQANYDKAE